MIETNFWPFLAAACLIAAIPGPGIFYVAVRTLSEGRASGFASTAGTALGGLVHVVAGSGRPALRKVLMPSHTR